EPVREHGFRNQHEHRRGTVGIAVVADLAVLVRAPAHHAPGTDDRAGMVRTDADRLCAAGETADIDGHEAVGARSVPELAPAVAAPALHAAGTGARAGVRIAGGDRCDATGKPVHVHRHVPLGLGAVAEFAVLVRAPAFRRPAAGHRAGVETSRADRAVSPGQPASAHLRVPRRCRAVAELALAVPAPALHAAAAGERAGVLAAGGDRLHATGEAADLHRRKALGIGAVAELPEA